MRAVTQLPRGRTIVRATTGLLVCAVVTLAGPAAGARAQSTCAGSATAPSAQTLGASERAVICLVNAHRTSHNLRALTLNGHLVRGAGRQSRDMVRRAFFAHVTPSGVGLSERMRRSCYIRGDGPWAVGENLAWGTGPLSTAAATVAAWIASPAHNRVLLDADFREVGVGIAVGLPVAPAGGLGGLTGATYTLDVGETGV